MDSLNDGDVYCFEGNITLHGIEHVQGSKNRMVFVSAYHEIEHFSHVGDVNKLNSWGQHKKNEL